MGNIALLPISPEQPREREEEHWLPDSLPSQPEKEPGGTAGRKHFALLLPTSQQSPAVGILPVWLPMAGKWLTLLRAVCLPTTCLSAYAGTGRESDEDEALSLLYTTVTRKHLLSSFQNQSVCSILGFAVREKIWSFLPVRISKKFR